MKKGFIAVLVGAVIIFGLTSFAQTIEIGGPDEIGRCSEAIFTVTLTNDTTQTFSSIVITETRPNANFRYVPGSAEVTLDDGTVILPAEPTESGLDLVWEIDQILGYGYGLPAGGVVTVRFDLSTNCDAVSGTHTAAAQGTGFIVSPTDSMSTEVLPGAVRIYKDPSVVEAHVGETVTWTITVESTGLGPIDNVVVTDTLGTGLRYVGSSPAGTPNGQEITWDLGMIPSGEEVQVQIQAEVTACDGLEETADARFGCDDGSICYDTAIDGGTATASVHLLVDNPLLEFTPPAIEILYCDPAGTTVTVPVENSGDGPATDVRIEVNFPAEIQVQNVQGGASWDGTYFHLPDLSSGDSFNLTFDAVYTGDWCGGGPSGNLYWEAIYDNVCGDEFRPPAKFGSYGTDYGPTGPPTISASITGPDQVQICTEYDYAVSVSFSGLDSCGGGTTGDISIRADIPDGFTVTDAGGGSWTPGGDGTGGTIAWSTPSDTPLSTDITLRTPGSSRCGQVGDLNITATATDCCGCTLTGEDSASIAIECRALVDTMRRASPSTQEKCGTVSYENTYTFADDPALDGVSFDELAFIEHADNAQDYVDGTLSITIDGASASPIALNDTTPGGTLEIDGINDTSSVRGHTLVISYLLGFTTNSQPNSCPSSYSFYSWSELNLGPDCLTGDECTEYCTKSEATLVEAATPSMSVSISGLPDDFVDPCGSYDITLTLTKSSEFDPYDVLLHLENLNYYLVDPGSIQISGVQPTSPTPTEWGTYYEWDYGDAFVGEPNGAESVLTFQVRKRCSSGVGLTSSALFDDSCGYSSCSVSASDSPYLMRQPLLYIYKAPEVIYATEKTVTWTIYVTNGGAGPAYEVWVDDTLGSGLAYDSSAVDPDVVVTPNQDHTGIAINGASWYVPVIEPGGTRTIHLTARLVGCTDLTDEVQAGLGCGGNECLTPVEDSAYVLIPDSVVAATSYTGSPIPVCTDQYATITIKNAGDPTVYHLVAHQSLPTGLSYVPGSTEWDLDGGGWEMGNDPTSSGGTITWTEAEIDGLTSLSSDSTLKIRFKIHADCSFTDGDPSGEVEYKTVCDAPDSVPIGRFHLDSGRPSLSVSKAAVSPFGPIDCGAEVTWRIDVTNDGDATADYVWIEDTLGDGFAYVSSQGDGTYSVDDGCNSGQKVTWVLEDLPPGTTASLYLTARESGSCGPITNSVQARWGCGDDGDISSCTDDSECFDTAAATADYTGTRRPALALTFEMDPGSVPSCGTATLTLTIRNTSTAAARDIDVRATLPPGVSYVPGTSEIDSGSGFSPAADPSASGSDLVWYDDADPSSDLCDEIPAGGSAAIRFQVQADCYTTGASIPFVVRFSDCCEVDQYQTGVSPSVPPSVPSLSVEKELITPEPGCGEDATWRITVTNTGSAPADRVRIDDLLGGNLTYVSSDPTATDMGGSIYAWEVGPLDPGESSSVEITARLDQPTTCAPDLRTNTARATWGCGTPDGDPRTSEGCESGISTEDSDLLPIPDLSVSELEATLSCNLDGTSTLQVPIRNTGEADSHSVSIRVYVDGALGYETAEDIPAGGSYPLSLTAGPLKCGEGHTFRVAVDEDDAVCECDESDDEITVSITCPCPALVTGKETVEVLRGGVPTPLGTPVEPGDVIVYRLSVRNVGGGKAFAIEVSDTLPAEFLYVSGSTSAVWPGGSYTADPNGSPGPDLSWDISAELAPGESLTLDFRAVVTSGVSQGQVYTDTMHAIGEEGDGTPIPPDMSSTVPDDDDPDDSSSSSQVAAAIPGLTVDKEIIDVIRNGTSIWPTGTVEPGDLIHYRFTVRNVGEGSAYDVDITDELPAGLEYDTDHADGTYTVDDPVASGSLGIPDGATGSLSADISAEIGGGGTLVADFYAYVTSSVQQGTNIENYAAATGVDGYGVPIPKENPQIGDVSDDDPDDPDADDTGLTEIGIAEPGLQLTKEIVDVIRNGTSIWPIESVLPEDVLCYRVEAKNIGLGTAYDVDFTDTLPIGTEYETAYGPGTYAVDAPPQSGTLPFADGATGALYADISVRLDPGGTLLIEYRVLVRPDAQPGSVLINSAEVTGDDGAGTGIPAFNPDTGDTYPDSDPTEIPVGIPALVTDKGIYVDPCACEAPSFLPGTKVRLSLAVTNVGTSTAYRIAFEDLLPDGLTYVDGSSEVHAKGEIYRIEPVFDPDEGLLTWITGLSAVPGETIRILFDVLISPDLPCGTELTDRMTASGSDYLHAPIPTDASGYSPADTDPCDSSSLTLTVCSQPETEGCVVEGAEG